LAEKIQFLCHRSARGLYGYGILCYPIIIRPFRAGDRFKPLGLKGFQKLKKFFINNKVPFSQKKKIPIWNAQEKLYG
jgi:tRNA(Ile)-lysidine synthetase-like protein